MRTVSLRLADLQRSVIPIGFEDENLHTQVRIDCKKLFEEYPNALPSLAVVNPHGTAYPAIVTKDGDYVVWDVTASDTAVEGTGEIQLTFVTGEEVSKSYVGKVHVMKSIRGSGTAPDPIQNWITIANVVLDSVAHAMESALHAPIIDDNGYWNVWDVDGEEYVPTEYKAEGTDGLDGVGITSIEKTGTSGLVDTYTVTFTNGTSMTFTVTNGEDGTDGISPTATVTKSGKIATITITDKNGTTSVQLHDGEDADPTELIDDTSTGAGKTWSAQKLDAEKQSLLTEINSMSTATATDVGKALSPKTVSNGKVTEWKFVSAGGGGGGGGGADIDDTAGAGDTDKAWSANKLTGKFGKIENLEKTIETGLLTGFAQGGVSQSTGIIDTTNTAKCYVGKIPMKAGDKFTYTRAENTITTNASLIIYNTEGTYLSGRGIISGNSITFDADGMFAITCVLNTNVSATMEQAIASANASFPYVIDKTIKIVETINEHGKEIINLDGRITKFHGMELSQSDLKKGIYYKVTNGVVSQNTESSAQYCSLMDVSALRGMKMKVWMNTARSGSSRSFGFCDSEGNVGSYATESNFGKVADGGYYIVLKVDEDFMFFSCSSDPTKIRIVIEDSENTIREDKYYHISFDDVILCLQDITTNASTYNSIFENDLFGWCKEMHDLFGATFSFYVFYANDVSNPTWTLEDCTNKFASEFSANADWMRFGLHAYAQGANATGREAYAEDDYSDTITQLVRITGSAKCIDRVPRLHEYNGTLTALTAMRDCNVGPVGFIASADYAYDNPRDSYYFDSDQNAYIHQHYYMYDPDTALHFVKTSIMFIGGNYNIANLENMADYMQMNRYVEVFQHENQMTSGNKSTMRSIINAMSYSHKPYFMMDIVRTN